MHTDRYIDHIPELPVLKEWGLCPLGVVICSEGGVVLSPGGCGSLSQGVCDHPLVTQPWSHTPGHTAPLVTYPSYISLVTSGVPTPETYSPLSQPPPPPVNRMIDTCKS